MSRPTKLYIDTKALMHNIACIRRRAPDQAIIAMVKANAYSCGVGLVVPILAPFVEAFGVSCLEEARQVRQYSPDKECILFQGIFTRQELSTVLDWHLTQVIHTPQQLAWVTAVPLPERIKVWVKVDTGMHRLGFLPQELAEVIASLTRCAWIDPDIGIMTHLACADEPEHPALVKQLACWDNLVPLYPHKKQSLANSAALLALPHVRGDAVRPGIMLYGISPFVDKIGSDFGLMPVMHFKSILTSIKHYAAGESIGYGATWHCARPSIIGIVPVGYGDGYPRHLSPHTPTWINGVEVPIVGRVSMDMLSIDLTDCPGAEMGDVVELWGEHVPIERVAKHAHTIAHELMCRVSQRVIREYKEE